MNTPCPHRRPPGVASLPAICLLLLFLLPATSPARAAQPLATDDAAVVTPKTCQLEVWNRSANGAQSWRLHRGIRAMTWNSTSISARQTAMEQERSRWPTPPFNIPSPATCSCWPKHCAMSLEAASARSARDTSSFPIASKPMRVTATGSMVHPMSGPRSSGSAYRTSLSCLDARRGSRRAQAGHCR